MGGGVCTEVNMDMRICMDRPAQGTANALYSLGTQGRDVGIFSPTLYL
jgi:hypothetical protein